jgi:hypothetical protein
VTKEDGTSFLNRRYAGKSQSGYTQPTSPLAADRKTNLGRIAKSQQVN